MADFLNRASRGPASITEPLSNHGFFQKFGIIDFIGQYTGSLETVSIGIDSADLHSQVGNHLNKQPDINDIRMFEMITSSWSAVRHI